MGAVNTALDFREEATAGAIMVAVTIRAWFRWSDLRARFARAGLLLIGQLFSLPGEYPL
jgi:hypothetical protein